jgi:hypothetical protein
VNDFSALGLTAEYRRRELLREADAERLAARARGALPVAQPSARVATVPRAWSAGLATLRVALAALLVRVARLVEPRSGTLGAADGADCLADLHCIVCWDAEAGSGSAA